MNIITTGATPKTMTSREIADTVGNAHESVLKTIRRLRAEGIVSGNEAPYTHEQNGQTYTEFCLTYRDTMVVASGYSAELRAKVIDRWMELEKTGKPALPQTFAQALRLAAEQAETIEQQAAQLAIAAPAVAFVDRYVESSSGAKGFREVCKLLRIKESKFREFLKDKQIMYKLGGEWAPYAAHIDAGRFEVKAGTSEANGHAFNTAKFTAKGVQWVAGELAKHRLVDKV